MSDDRIKYVLFRGVRANSRSDVLGKLHKYHIACVRLLVRALSLVAYGKVSGGSLQTYPQLRVHPHTFESMLPKGKYNVYVNRAPPICTDEAGANDAAISLRS